jgi:hypothetical protein
MNEDQLQLPRQPRTRTALRRAGLGVLAVGGLLVLVGMGSFFASFASMQAPRFFWCAFLGMPLLFVGSVMTIFGFLGAFHRYVAGEAAPVAKDVVNYMGQNIRPGLKAMASAVTEGVAEGLDAKRADPAAEKDATA